MSTVIDELIVRLGLDSKSLDSKSGSATKNLKGLEEQGKKTEGSVKKIGDSSKTAARGVDELARNIGGFLALLGSSFALKQFVTDTIAANAALERFSKNINLDVSTVSAWGNAVEEVGGSAKGLQGSMDMLSKAQTELRLTGQSALIPYFSALGVSLAIVSGQAKPVDQILLDLSERFSHMDRTTANNMGRMMGIDQDTLNLLLQGRREVELTLKRQKEFNAVSKEQAEEAVKLQRSLVGLKQSFTALGRDLLQQASPALEKMLSLLSEFGGWLQANREFVTDFAEVLGVVALGFAAISIAVSPIALTTAAIVALAAGIALLWQDYQVWKRGGDSLIPWGKWKAELDAAGWAIVKLDGIAERAFGSIAKAASGVFNALSGNFGAAASDFAAAYSNPVLKEPATLSKRFTSTLNVPGQKTLGDAIAQVEGFNAKGDKPNRPQRNHNPGDIEYGDFAKSQGATGTDGRFAIFPDDETGTKALYALLQSSKYADLTIPQAINKFAPPNENNTKGYSDSVLKQTGLSATTTVRQALSGIQGASSTVASAGSSTTPAPGSADNSTTVTTGDIIIHTQATDANGIARDMGRGLDFLFTSQANSGQW